MSGNDLGDRRRPRASGEPFRATRVSVIVRAGLVVGALAGRAGIVVARGGGGCGFGANLGGPDANAAMVRAVMGQAWGDTGQ